MAQVLKVSRTRHTGLCAETGVEVGGVDGRRAGGLLASVGNGGESRVLLLIAPGEGFFDVSVRDFRIVVG